jgi:hypothetical protein
MRCRGTGSSKTEGHGIRYGEPLPVEDCYDGYLKSVGIINTVSTS